MRRLLQRLLGGRPMTPAPGIAMSFYDHIAGKMVYYYIDGNGRYWMAHSRWSWFRVPVGFHTKDKPRVWRSAR